jgi:subtilisin family serine protease
MAVSRHAPRRRVTLDARMSAGSALLPRSLFGDTQPDLLFEIPGAQVPLALLARAVAPPAAAFVAPALPVPPPSAAIVAPAPVGAPTITVIANPASVPTVTAATAMPDPLSLAAADQALGGSVARGMSGATGAGVVVGILSDSFNITGAYADDVAHGLLNPGATVLKEGPAGSSDEGRAMAELIHQVAPDAQIVFYSGFGGQADFAHGISALAAAGASIIVDDVTYLNEPFYQDGAAIQAAVEQVVASGVSYFTSASNQGGNFFESAFTPLTTALPGLSGGFVAANFGTAAAATPPAPTPYVNLSIARGATATIDLQWDAPFASIGASAGATTSLGMVLYDATGRIVAYALRSEIGGDPVALLQFTNSSASTNFRLAVITDGGQTVPSQFKFIAYGQGTSIADPRAGQGSGSIIGHEMVPEANTVGAIAYSQTAAFGGGGSVEGFSSRGPGSFLFDAEGNRLDTKLSSTGVDYVAPDGSATSVFNPFYGTSAAAPNAAAVAALMLQVSPGLTPAQVSAILASSTIAASGPAGSAGAGLIQAAAAVKAAIAMAGPAGQSHSFTIPPAAATPPGTVVSSAAIRNAANAIAAAYQAVPNPAADYTATPDLASGLVLATGDSLGNIGAGDLALLHLVDPTPGSLYDPVHLLA